MKNIIHILIVFIMAGCAVTKPIHADAQPKPIPSQRSSPSVTAMDAYSKAQYTFGLPTWTDTSLRGGLDSLGSILWVNAGGNKGLWLRDTNNAGSHLWAQMATKADITSQSYWTLSGGTLYNNAGTNVALFETTPLYKFDVFDGISGHLGFQNGRITLYDDIVRQNVKLGFGVGSNLNGNYNVGIGNAAISNVNGDFNIGIGSESNYDAQGSHNTAVGVLSSVTPSGSDNTSFGYQANSDIYGINNTAIGSLAQTATAILADSMSHSVVGTGTSTFTGTQIAAFITNASLSIGQAYAFRMDWRNGAAMPPPFTSLSNPTQIRRGIITNSNTITFSNFVTFTGQGSDSVLLTVYNKQNNSIAIGYGAQTPSSSWVTIGNTGNTFFQIGTAVFNMQSNIHEGWVLMNHAGVYVPDTIAGGGGGGFSFTSPLHESGGVVTIDNASTSAKGAVQFTGSDFILSSGVASLNYPTMQVVSGSVNGIVTPTLYNLWNGKADPPNGAITTFYNTNGTANKMVGLDGSGKLISLTASTTEGNYLVGVTSPLQTQLNNKLSTTLPTGQIFIGVGGVAASVTPSGDATISAAGFITLANVLTAGICSSCNLSINAKGQVVAFADGTSGGGPGGTVTGVTGTLPIVITSNPLVTPNVTVNPGKADGTTLGVVTGNASDFNDNGAGLWSIDYTNGQKATALVPGFMTVAQVTALNSAVQNTRTITTTSPLIGGGDLSANRTIAIGGLSTIGTANFIVGVNAGATAWEYKQLIAGSNITITHGVGTVTIASSGGGGGVVSVGLAAPTGLTVSGSPVTGSGTLTLSTVLNGMLYGNGANTIAAATITSPLTFSGGVLSMPAATNSVSGYLTNVDRTSFAAKANPPSGAITTIYNSNLPSNSSVVSDASGKITNGAASAAQINFLSTLTSDVQVQLNNKEPLIIYPFFNVTSSATPTFNFNNGFHQQITLTNNSTFSFSNFGDGHVAIIEVIQDGTGGRTVSLTLSGTIIWLDGTGSGTAPTINTSANKASIIGITKNGSNFIVKVSKQSN